MKISKNIFIRPSLNECNKTNTGLCHGIMQVNRNGFTDSQESACKMVCDQLNQNFKTDTLQLKKYDKKHR